MKKIIQLIFLSAFLLFIGGCDKGFVEINTNPFALNSMDPALLFAGSERQGGLGGWESESTIIQQFVNPFNLGATLGFNFNENIDGMQGGSFGYTGSIKTFIHILDQLKGTTTKVNLVSYTRLLKAFAFMNIVDHHGNVPYFKAGLAVIEGQSAFYPSYDSDAAIYEDLYLEITDALSKMDPTGDYVSSDLFYGAKANFPITTAAAQVAQWKKFGNSLLLRFGMRYSKLDPAKAALIVAKAFAGGVMASNNDNMFVTYDGTNYTNGGNGGLTTNNPRYYYAAEPFVNQLKSTLDPRSKFIIASFADPNNPLGDAHPVTNPALQFGLPVGILNTDLTIAKGYRGPKLTGYAYSQVNVDYAASTTTPTFWMTYSQTSLLLAEAAKRGWVAGGDAQAKTYYEAGIKADMDVYAVILAKIKPNTAADVLTAITTAEYNAYIAQPSVAYTAANALNLINTQYWVSCFLNSSEAWANYRRTAFPVLARNSYNNALMANGGDGYVHRFTYPDEELTRNKANYLDAVSKLTGGVDDLMNRVFWDKP